jgi:hypothetical protein
MRTGLSGGDSTCFFVRSAKSLYFSSNPLSRTAKAGSDAVSINMRGVLRERCNIRNGAFWAFHVI